MATRNQGGAATVVRDDGARVLSDAEIASLGAGMPELPTGSEELEMTEAELAILQEKGANIAISDAEGHFDVENPLGMKGGTVLFKIGKGDSQFTGRLTDGSSDPEKIRLWHWETGAPRSLRRAHLFYYVAKGWLPRPPVGIEPPPLNVPCPSRLAGKKCRRFSSPGDAADHFRRSHDTEYKAVQSQLQSDRQERLDAILERLASGAESGQTDNNALAIVLIELQKTMQDLRNGTIQVVQGLDAESPAHGDATAIGAKEVAQP